MSFADSTPLQYSEISGRLIPRSLNDCARSKRLGSVLLAAEERDGYEGEGGGGVEREREREGRGERRGERLLPQLIDPLHCDITQRFYITCSTKIVLPNFCVTSDNKRNEAMHSCTVLLPTISLHSSLTIILQA